MKDATLRLALPTANKLIQFATRNSMNTTIKWHCNVELVHETERRIFYLPKEKKVYDLKFWKTAALEAIASLKLENTSNTYV